MKFEVEVPEDKVKEMCDFMEERWDNDRRPTTEEVLQELFCVGDRHGEECDIREDVKVRKID